MATKSVFQELNADALKHFGLESEVQYGLQVSQTSLEFASVIGTENKSIFNKIQSILDTPSVTNLKGIKKAFLLPGSPVSITRVKEALREHKITFTNDYEEADIFITHDDFSAESSSSERLLTTKLMHHIWNYYGLNVGSTVPEISAFCLANNQSIIYDDKIAEQVRYSYKESLPYDIYIITGMALHIAYKIEFENIPTISLEDCLGQSANKIILTEDLLQDIVRMVTSYNEDDNKIASKIIPTIDYETNIHLLWKLSQEARNQMYKFNRDKDFQYWMKASDFDSLYYKSAQDMILYLEKKELLNNENFRYLEPIVRKDIHISNRDLYVFKVQVKPEYVKYLTP